MKYKIKELPKAQADIQHIFYWIFERSPQGASAWMDAYDRMLLRLAETPDTFPLAHESKDCEREIKSISFKTRRGKIYRAIFFIENNIVYIARVLGPGQAPIDPHSIQ